MTAFFEMAGRGVLGFVQYLGEVALLSGDSFKSLATQRLRWKETVLQLHAIGVKSLPVVLLTGAFIGMVFAAQTYFQFHKVRMDTSTGPAVSIALARELGPIITSLMVAGRVGAAMAAEIGTMRVTEQIDALRSLAVHPVDYLVAPRLIAMVISLPLLTAMSVLTGICCSWVVSIEVLGIDSAYYLHNMYKYTDANDINTGLIKVFLFSFIIVFVSCHKGMQCEGGAEGVGKATTEAVVNSSISILIANFFATMLLSKIIPP
ncbi:MAG: ABC transporter permease [Verrucomicrobiae bacterium]|nr:ABC transporter permease [Verrucomicrobiae bacterium]